MISVDRVRIALRRGQPDRVPVLESVVDEKVARAAVPGCRDVADCMDRLDMDGVGCSWQHSPPRGQDTDKGPRRRFDGSPWIVKTFQAEGTGLEPATPLLGHHISSVAANHSLTLRKSLRYISLRYLHVYVQ